MHAKPRLAINDLAKERIKLWVQMAKTHEVDELLIQRLLRNMDSVLSSLPANDKTIPWFYHEQGYLNAYRKRTAEVLRLFDLSIELGFHPVAAGLSKAHALFICGEISMGRDVLAALEPDGTNLEEVESVAAACAHFGLFFKARELLHSIGKGADDQYRESLLAAQLLEDAGIDDIEVTRRLNVAAGIVKNMTAHPLIAYSIFAMRDEGILFRFVVKDSIEKIVQIDRAIDETMAEQFDGLVDEVLSIGVKPYAPNTANPVGGAYRVYL